MPDVSRPQLTGRLDHKRAEDVIASRLRSMSETVDPQAHDRGGFIPIPHERIRAGLAAWGLTDAELVVLPRGASGEVFLLHLEGQRFVAKYAYMRQRDFEPGLRAAEAASEAGMRVAKPVRTATDDLTASVEWPIGTNHPLAVMDYVAGSPLDRTVHSSAAVVGTTLGRVQRRLFDVGAKRLALHPPRDYLAYLRSTDQDLGEQSWLHDYNAGLVAEIDELTTAERLTVGPGVWDGPEVVVDNDQDPSLGLLDFGSVDVHPVAHVLAYGITQISPPGREDESRVQAFLDAFTSACPVSPQDLEATPAFRRVTLAIYAKFMSSQRVRRRLDAALDDPLDRTLRALRE
jgi:Ser/Thr protein kinase RdoA (MazF antagonist)